MRIENTMCDPRQDTPTHDRSQVRVFRLVGDVLAEQTDEWAEGRRCLELEILAKSRLDIVANGDHDITRRGLPARTN